MLTLCDNCKNHYDDSFQSEECGGVGGSPHRRVAMTPVHEHVIYTKAAWLPAYRGQGAVVAAQRAHMGPAHHTAGVLTRPDR